MSTQRYSVAPHSISTLLNWVTIKEIAIPEIQRPFVWEARQVRDLLDSLFRGYPVGYLIAWKNPNVKLKDGTTSHGKRILIDGQQRVTALMAAILGHEVLTKDYETIRIRIAFNPQTEKFEVHTPILAKDSAWISDVSRVFAADAKLMQITREYVKANKGQDEDKVFSVLEKLKQIANNHVGLIELAEDLDIETVTDIFIRVNSAGTELSQADFAMSKIATNETFGGNTLRKAIDYFCHLAKAPEFYKTIEKRDPAFASSEYFPAMKWLKDVNDDIYDPAYTDMLRVAFTSEFGRGRLADLVALLSGRNFETKVFEEKIAEESFKRLKKGVLAFINQTHFERFIMILRSAGFVTADLILAYVAAQVKAGELGFLSRDITVDALVRNRCDVHHVYPKKHLKGLNKSRGEYNQIANFVLAQSEINIAIGDKAPDVYFKDLAKQIDGGKKKYGGITDESELRANLRAHCLPESMLDGDVPAYEDFLAQRRVLMAKKIKNWFGSL